MSKKCFIGRYGRGQQINHIGIIPVLTGAIQELNARIEALEKELNAYQGNVTSSYKPLLETRRHGTMPHVPSKNKVSNPDAIRNRILKVQK